MNNKSQLLGLIFLFVSYSNYAQLSIAGKAIIGGIGTPEDQFQVNGDMQLEEPSPFLRFKSTNNTNAGLNWKNSLDVSVGAFFLDPLSGNVFLDIDGFNPNGATAEFTFGGNGALGIGFNNPQAPLHLMSSSSELAHLESSATDKWIGFYQNGIRKGKIGNKDQALFLDAEDTSGQLDFRTAGSTRLTINSNGDVLSNTATRLGTFTLAHPSGSGSTTGLTLLNNAGGGNYWNFYVVNSDNDLQLFYKGTFKGEFSSTDGSYTSVSDRKYKRNIRSMDAVLDRIRQLSPKTYQMQEDKTGQHHIGFIAQEVAPLFPELVHHGVVGDSPETAFTMNYGAMAVVAIKGIQELIDQRSSEEDRLVVLEEDVLNLQRENKKLTDRLHTMSAQIEELRDLVRQLARDQEDCCRLYDLSNSAAGSAIGENDRRAVATLQQNEPNPFRETTRIEYYIPEEVSEAFIQVVDGNGRIWKRLELEGSGQGELQLNTRNLPPGTYAYSLFIEGKLVSTRQMILSR